MSESAIRIEGLAQFSRALRKVDSDLPKSLRLALNKAANLLVDEARSGVPRRSGKAAGSIIAKSTRTQVRVAEGGKRAPYMPWLDYGGKVGRKKKTQRKFLKEGRYVYPAYHKLKDSGKIQAVLEAALLEVVRDAGLAVD